MNRRNLTIYRGDDVSFLFTFENLEYSLVGVRLDMHIKVKDTIIKLSTTDESLKVLSPNKLLAIVDRKLTEPLTYPDGKYDIQEYREEKVTTLLTGKVYLEMDTTFIEDFT